MTQLDLPPISFARYLDLLKRRRWHVIPVSIAGLLIGALVAFLIPRYYVAQTMVQLDGRFLDLPAGSDDPIKPLLGTAEVMIRFSVHDALQKLGWPEAFSGDDNARRQFEEDVRSRIDVQDVNPSRGRQIAHLRISYRDTDGVRAKELTNALVGVWLEGARREFEASARANLHDVNTRVGQAEAECRAADRELTTFETAHAIEPADWMNERDGGRGPKGRERDGLAAQIAKDERDLKISRDERDRILARLETTPTEVEKTEKANIPEAIAQQLEGLQAALLEVESALQINTPAHPKTAYWLGYREQLKEQLAALRSQLELDKTNTEPNPAWHELRAAADGKEGEIARLEASLDANRARVAELDGEIGGLGEVWGQYRALKRKLEAAEQRRADFRETLREANDRLRIASQEVAYKVLDKASVPPRPTEPNVTLVALAGSAIGLAVAIGLILLIDILQSTFKTVEDVEHLLPVPVLGRLSYMETPEQRREVHSRRTRAGLLAGAFLVLMVSLITIYYVRPATLPALVRDTLDLLLGAPATEQVK